MFAGIYYGGMYGGSTTSILLNTPGESASIMTALEGNKMAKAGRGAAALATAAHRVVRRRHASRRSLLALVAPPVVDWAVSLGPADYFALAMLAFVAVSTVLGASPLRGLAVARARAVPRPGRHRRADRAAAASRSTSRSSPTASTWWSSRSRCSPSARRCTSPVRLRHGPVRGDADRSELGSDPGGLPPLVEAVAARHRARLPVRRAAGRRRRAPDVPVVRDREAAHQAQGRVRQGRDRGRRRSGGGEQRGRGRRARARCSRSGCRPRRPRRSCWPRSRATASSPGRCCSRPSRRWSGR